MAIIHFKTGGLHSLIDWLFLMAVLPCLFIFSVLIGGGMSILAGIFPLSEYWRDVICIGAVFTAAFSTTLWVLWRRPCQVLIQPNGFQFGKNQVAFTDLYDVIIKRDKGGDIGNYFCYDAKLYFIVLTGSCRARSEVLLSRHYTRGGVLKDVRQTFLELALRAQQHDSGVSKKLTDIINKPLFGS